MAGVNKVMLVGHLGRDPDLRRTNNGDPVVSFSIATSESWRDKTTGDRKERTEWHNVVIFNENLCKVAEQFLKKGSKVFVEGSLHTREYTDRDGGQRRTTEVVLQRFRGELTLLDKSERQAPDPDSYGHTTTREGSAPSNQPASSDQPTGGMIDDDIPF